MAFASTTELASWLQVASINTATATLALAVASSAIRTYCGWAIEEEDISEAVDGTGERSLWLPTLKLTAVGPVVVDGDTLVSGTDYDWTSYGKLIRNGRWPRTPRSVTVNYTHGYEIVPEVVKGVCLTLAARAYNNPDALKSRSETMGPFATSASYADVSGMSLAEDEMKILGTFKLEHVG